MTVDPPAGARRPIGFWLKLLDTLIDAGFDEVLAADRLERRHWQLLNGLSGGAATVAELTAAVAPFTADSGPSVREVLADLTARDWVDDIAGTARLTAAGVAAHGRLATIVATHRRQLMGDVTPTQYTATIEVLHQMALNLGWTEP